MIYIILIGLTISIVASYISYLLSKLKRMIYKYIPPVFWFAFSLIFMINGDYFTGDWTRLGYTIFAFISVMPTIINLVFSIILDVKRKNK